MSSATSTILQLGRYDVNLLDRLGQGGFGVVYLGTDRQRKRKVAVKQCATENDKRGSIAIAELKNFMFLKKHPHFVKMRHCNFQNNAVWIVMEFCEGGDLEQYFRRVNPSIQEQLDLMFQSASAIEFMHGQRHVMVHRDIKPANILIKSRKGRNIVKVTDFGLSKVSDNPDPGKTALFTTKAGTAGYMAPEFFLPDRPKYTKDVDTFSLGLVFLAMVIYKPKDHMMSPTKGMIAF